MTLLLAFHTRSPKMNPQVLIHLGRLGVETQPALGSFAQDQIFQFFLIDYSPTCSCLARNFHFDHKVWHFPLKENPLSFPSFAHIAVVSLNLSLQIIRKRTRSKT